mmetsp:Transcript_3277/g.7389  ORF Transcript_3277/g.7389 Transcript_3277/m.7389 type:complete len:478 (+) Transcript_3277:832-2265(+)
MRNGPVPRKLANLISPISQFLWLVLLLRHEFYGIKRRGVADYSLAGLDHISILETHSHRSSVLDENLVDVGIQLQLSAILLQTPLKSISQLARPSDRNGEGRRLLEEAFQNVEQMCRHGSLGGEPAEDAHGIDKVPQKRHGHEFIHRLAQIIKRQRQIGKDIRILQHKRQTPRRGGQKPRILPEIQQRHRLRRSSQGTKPLPQGLPLCNGLGSILPALLHQQLLKPLSRPDGEPPIPRRSPISQPLVRLDRHGLLQNIENHPQRIQTRTIQPLEDAGPHLETVFSPVVHPTEGVGAPSHLDVTFQDQDARAVLGAEGPTGEAAHAGSDDDDVVFARVAREAVAGAGISGFFVFGFEGHVVGEGHDFVAGGGFGLRDVGVFGHFGGGGGGGGDFAIGGFFDGGMEAREEGAWLVSGGEGVGGGEGGEEGDGHGRDAVFASDHGVAVDEMSCRFNVIRSNFFRRYYGCSNCCYFGQSLD